jgi:hypothetical protein
LPKDASSATQPHSPTLALCSIWCSFIERNNVRTHLRSAKSLKRFVNWFCIFCAGRVGGTNLRCTRSLTHKDCKAYRCNSGGGSCAAQRSLPRVREGAWQTCDAQNYSAFGVSQGLLQRIGATLKHLIDPMQRVGGRACNISLFVQPMFNNLKFNHECSV